MKDWVVRMKQHRGCGKPACCGRCWNHVRPEEHSRTDMQRIGPLKQWATRRLKAKVTQLQEARAKLP